MTSRPLVLLLGISMALVVGCSSPEPAAGGRGGGGDKPRATQRTRATERPRATPRVRATPRPTPRATRTGSVTIPSGAAAVVRLARRQLAERLGITPDQTEVVLLEAVEWPSSALGCPQPGIDYAEVMTPGFRLLIRAAGKLRTVHTDALRRAIPCEESLRDRQP
jgi:hypothetical protein